MQTLVKEGYGFALIREGTPLDKELTTRPIARVDWTVDTAVVYHRERHPKTIPVLVKKLRRLIQKDLYLDATPLNIEQSFATRKQTAASANKIPEQLSLLR